MIFEGLSWSNEEFDEAVKESLERLIEHKITADELISGQAKLVPRIGTPGPRGLTGAMGCMNEEDVKRILKKLQPEFLRDVKYIVLDALASVGPGWVEKPDGFKDAYIVHSPTGEWKIVNPAKDEHRSADSD